MLHDLHTDFSGGRSGSLVFPSPRIFQFVVVHTVKGFGIVNKTEVDVFLDLSCFFDDPTGIGNLISGCSAFPKTSLNIRKFTIHILLKTWRILYISLLPCDMSAIVWYFVHSLALPFFGTGIKTHFPVLWPLLSFPNLLAY